MIDVIENIINLIMLFINGLYNIQIDLSPNNYIKLGDLTICFLVVVLSIYFVFRGLGIIKKGDD